MEEIINDYEHSKIQSPEDTAAPVAAQAGKKRSLAQLLLIAFLIFLNLLVAFLLALNLVLTPGLFGRLVNVATTKLPALSQMQDQPPVKETPAAAPAPPQALEVPVPAQVEPVRLTDSESQEIGPNAIGATPDESAEEEPAPAATAAPEPEPVAPAPEKQQKALMAKSGDMVSALGTKEYGTLTNTILDMIKRANPGIKDLDRIYVGDKILIPPIDIDSLIVVEDNGTLSIHLATFSAESDAQQFKKMLADRNYAPSVYPVNIIGSKPWYRVTLGNHPDRSAAIAFAQNIDLDSTLLPFPVNDIMQSLKGMEGTD
jgi:phage tail protein X